MVTQIALNKPTLILGAGIAGSGKTTTLTKLPQYINNSFYISKDTLNDSFLSTHNDCDVGIKKYIFSGPKIRMDHDFYHENVKFQSYNYMLMLAKDNLELGKHPILEGNYTKELRKGYLEEVLFPFFEKVDHKTKIIFCYTDEENIKKRVYERNALRDKSKDSEESWRKLFEEQPPLPPELEKYDHIKVDTTTPLKEQDIVRILDYLSI